MHMAQREPPPAVRLQLGKQLCFPGSGTTEAVGEAGGCTSTNLLEGVASQAVRVILLFEDEEEDIGKQAWLRAARYDAEGLAGGHAFMCFHKDLASSLLRRGCVFLPERPDERMESSRTLDELLEAVRALPAEEQKQLRRALDSDVEMETEAAFARRMTKEGLLERRRTPAAKAASFQPVPVRGTPVSTAIIEERR